MPAVVYRPRDGGSGAAVVTLHGGGQSKDVVGPSTASMVVSTGVTLVAVDLYLHGEHFDDRASTLPVGYETLLEIVRHTAEELVEVVANLGADDGIDAQRIGVRGESLGAYAALAALGLGAGFACGLSLAGAADFEAALAHSLAQEGAAPERIVAERERLRPLIAAIDPLGRIENVAPRPLMMVHGTADTSVPLDAHRSLYDALAPSHARADGDLVFVTHSGGHVRPHAVDRLAWDWLIRTL
jgi:fermentation-respiration switch protein FrsA (DUF1100 family)